MDWLDRQSISTRINLIMLTLFILLLAISFALTYVRNRSLVTKVVINNARILAGEVIHAIGEQHPTFAGDAHPESHDPVRLQRLINDISLRDPYRIRIVSLDNTAAPLFHPDAAEREQLQKLVAEGGTEVHAHVAAADENQLLYLRPLRDTEECITCHGDPAGAPPEVRRRFPPGSPIYGHRRGELMGAVTVAVATREISDEVWRTMAGDMLFRLVIFLILVIAVTAKLSRKVILPVEVITKRMTQVTETGEYQPVALQGVGIELTRLANALNEMMRELARRDEQHVEAEKRFRGIVDMTHEGVVTFLRDGKIVMANRRAEKLLGEPANLLAGSNFFSLLVQGESLREKLTELASAGDNGQTKTCRQILKRSDGASIPVTLAVISSGHEMKLFTALLWEKDEPEETATPSRPGGGRM